MKPFFSLFTSFCVHILGVAGLLLVRPTPEPAIADHLAVSVSLVAPRLSEYRTVPPDHLRKQAVRTRQSEDLPETMESVQALPNPPIRPFRPPEDRRQIHPQSVLAISPSEVSLEPLPAAFTPAPINMAHLPVLAPPPLKTDNLGSVELDRSRLTLHTRDGASRFESVENEPQRGATHASLKVGEFEGTPQGIRPRTSDGRAPAPANFGSPEVASQSMNRISTPTPNNVTAVEILSKPRPAYTEEGRRLAIEGEVLLDVLFSASGEIQITRLVRGLGHGLDEMAMAAAHAIQFRPAQRGNTPIDSSATVHILFQLAY